MEERTGHQGRSEWPTANCILGLLDICLRGQMGAASAKFVGEPFAEEKKTYKPTRFQTRESQLKSAIADATAFPPELSSIALDYLFPFCTLPPACVRYVLSVDVNASWVALVGS